MKAPFPYFGGKSWIAEQAWARFGDVPNYVEPFFGSGAVLLARPHAPKTETVNDADGFIANFWRAVQVAPDEVAQWADWPVNEADLAARHYWLVTEGKARMEKVLGAPDGFDAQVAGWWLWGICSWIGGGWCTGEGPWRWNSAGWISSADRGIKRQLPHLGDAGRGINRRVDDRGDYIRQTIADLAARLRNVRVCCGDWSRVCGPSVTHKHGITGVFLDPPYDSNQRHAGLYGVDQSVGAAVREWALAEGGNPLMRIALCGYEGEYELPGWECFEWKARGGFGSQGDEDGRGRLNAGRERIWFSPHCLRPSTGQLAFAMSDGPQTGALEVEG